MCAILDANAVHEVFGDSPPPAGSRFFDWVDGGSGRLVAGGKQLEELERGSPGFRAWQEEAVLSGKMKLVNERRVDALTDELDRSGNLVSDDPHVIALAQLSGARLLYSNDDALQDDFRNTQLLDNPQGRVYSTNPTYNPNKRFTPVHQALLNRRDLCGIAR